MCFVTVSLLWHLLLPELCIYPTLSVLFCGGMHTVSYRSTISTTSREANKAATPMGMKTMLTSMNAEMTHFGVRIGLQAGSSCCVNLEYLGRLVFLLGAAESADPLPAVALEEGAWLLIR
uniref:Uncharacterized protein MANES_03G079600 n=1 Tax=Rhizophora mucronata TaxID=61149 RepID=A0A2P2LZW0_RHIMU